MRHRTHRRRRPARNVSCPATASTTVAYADPAALVSTISLPVEGERDVMKRHRAAGVNCLIKCIQKFGVVVGFINTRLQSTVEFLLLSSETDGNRGVGRDDMNRSEFVLTVLAAYPDSAYDPVQVQKLFFLIDEKIPQLVGGRYFDFIAYHFGPFDKQIYVALEKLSSEGYIEIEGASKNRMYRLTNLGKEKGGENYKTLPSNVRDYIAKLSDFVRRLSFTELVSTIYKVYPDMKKNSVFQE